MEEAYNRFKQAIDYLRDIGKSHNQQDIADALAMGKANFSRAINGDQRYFTRGFLKRFVAAYSDYISEEWLLTGEGEMAVPDKTMRPHIGVKAAAGFMVGIGENDKGDDLRDKIPFLADYDFTITTDGQSMVPEIDDGDILACRISYDRANPPIGKICVIDSKEGAAVKVLKEASDSSVVLHSINPEYDDYEVAVSDLNRIAVVVGVIKKLA